MHFSFMRKLELEQGWVGEQEPGPHEFEKIGATWSELGKGLEPTKSEKRDKDLWKEVEETFNIWF